MSHMLSRGNRSRQPVSSLTPRVGRSKELMNDSLEQSPGKKRKVGPKHRGKQPMKKVTRCQQPSPMSDETSLTIGGSETGDEASDEESESEDDEPAVVAPSRRRGRAKMGRRGLTRSSDEIALPESTDSFFSDANDYYAEDDDPRLSPEENRKRFEDKVFADSDDEDDVYKAVEDISESEEEDIEQFEEQHIAAFFSEDESNHPDSYLNQIDGLSAYGFGDDSDDSIQFPSSHNSDAGTELLTAKRVHFQVEVPPPPFLSFADSPTIARALLPSALPDTGGAATGPLLPLQPDVTHGTMLEDLDDCMLAEKQTHVPTNVSQLT